MLGKLADGFAMVWQSLDERERFIALYGCAVLAYLIVSALAMPRKRDEQVTEQAPVVVVVRER